MSIHNITNESTYWVVGAFLFITLAIGLYAGRGIKNIKGYALGGRNFSTATLVMTLLATYIGGGATVGTTGEVYSIGIIVSLAYFGVTIQHLIFALLIAPKIVLFKNCLTLGDLMNQLYGKKAKILTGCSTLFYALFITTIQFFLIGKISYSLLGMKVSYGIMIGGSILGIYSAIGGIKAVTATDILQFLILIIMIPLIATLALKQVGGYKELFMSIPKEKFEIFGNKKFYYYLTFFLIIGAFPQMITNPAVMQRVFMSKSREQLRNKFFVAAAFDPAFRIIIMLIGLSAVILYPNLKSKEVLPHVINNLLSNGIMKGLAISGLLAVIMSSADSFLHSAGLLFTHDILKPIFGNKKKSFDELLYAKLSTVIIGMLAILLALEMNKGLNFRNVTFWAVGSTGPIFLFPLLVGILGLKPDKKTFVISIIVGIITFVLANQYLLPSMKMLAIPIGIVANGMTYMIVHLIQNKGFALVQRNKDDEKTKERLWKPSLDKLLSALLFLIPTPNRIFAFSKRSVVRYGANNMIFGIFCCITFTLPYFLWDHEDTNKYNLMTYMRFVGGMMAGLLIVKDQWKDFLKPYFPLFWHITLMYCLPFITTMMFLLTNGSLAWLMNVGTSIFFLILLVNGAVFLVLVPLGVALAIGFYSWQVGPIDISSLGFDINYLLVYQLLFSTIISLLFAYRKKLFYIIKGNLGVNLGLSLCHELRNTGLQSLSWTQMLREKMKRMLKTSIKQEGKDVYVIDKDRKESIMEDIIQAVDHNQYTVDIVATFEEIFLEFRDSIANPKICSIKSVVDYAILKYHFEPGQREKIKLNIKEDFYAKIPKSAFSFAISNIIRNAYKHGKATEIKIWLEKRALHIKDNGKGVHPSKLTKIFDRFYTTGDKKLNRGVGLMFAKQLVEGFYGKIWCDSEQGEGSYTEFVIEFPEVPSGEITSSSLIEVREEGKEEGEEKGKEEGKKEAKMEVARNLLKKNKNIETIKDLTGLTISEIEELKKNIQEEV